jgi:hypothetical protein
MKTLALFLTLCLCLPATAHADEAARRVKAQEMINLLHMDRLMKQMMDGVMAQVTAMQKQNTGSSITPDQQAKLDAFQAKVFALLDAQMGWKAMQPIYVDLYAKTFTDEELDGILAFYKSPAGIAMIDKLPQLTTQGQQIARERMVIVMPQLQQMIQDFTKEAAASAKPTKN